MKKINDIIIAFDGFSSCGKSTVAKQVANTLNYIYIDTGAMYRAVTLLAIQNGLINEKKIDTEKLKKILDSAEIKFISNTRTEKQETYLNDKNIEDKIRKLEVSSKVSYISELYFVREKLVAMQQNMGEHKRIVMDGRDIGTVVFPDAELKIFMTADTDVRAQRRYDELLSKGENVSLEEVKKNIEDRDYIDQNRAISPLRKAEDAIMLDNSNMTREEQLKKILELIEQKFSLE